MKKVSKVMFIIFVLVVCAAFYYGYNFYQNYVLEKEVLKKMIERLESDSRIAQVIVTETKIRPQDQKLITSIKFLEFDSRGEPLPPKYFTFPGNIIQFQSLVVRFDDKFVRYADRLKGKSIYLFWKVFFLDGKNTEEYIISEIFQIPKGYKLEGKVSNIEAEIWREFWDYALSSEKAISRGIKNAQIEAPGTKFIKGIIYTLKIEHDGGIRIDAQDIPKVLIGESF